MHNNMIMAMAYHRVLSCVQRATYIFLISSQCDVWPCPLSTAMDINCIPRPCVGKRYRRWTIAITIGHAWLHRYLDTAANLHATHWCRVNIGWIVIGGRVYYAISSVPLFFYFFKIIQTLVSFSVSRSYLIGVSIAQLRGHWSHMNRIWRI